MKLSHRMQAFLIALTICILFYWWVHMPSMRHSVLHTYTTEHATEYAIVGLFFWANADLALSFLRNRREFQSVRYSWLPSREGVEPVEHARSLYFHVFAGPAFLHNTKMFRRVLAAVTYVRERNSALGFREYLADLAQRDADETYARYSFPRFCVGILPILGLLGTVVHFGSALSGLTSDELTAKVPQIVSGMGTAFNTTCAALSASTTTMLFRYLIETQEEAVVTRVNQYVEDQLLHRFVEEESEPSEKLEKAIEGLNQLLAGYLGERFKSQAA